VSFKEKRKAVVSTSVGSSACSMLCVTAMLEKSIYYEQILRAIGQGLEALSVDAFDLEVANDIFMIEATATRSHAVRPNAPKRRPIRKAFLKICQSYKKTSPAQTPAGKLWSPALLRLQFTQTDIDNLERDGRALRSDWKGSPLAHSLPQLLRTVGWYVDQKQGCLHKISKNGARVSVTYMGSLGTENIETLTLLQIYDMWVHLFKQRKGYIKIGY
jgi:hypothetical protein